MKSRFLYRGEHEEMYRCSGGVLRPRLIKQPFDYVFRADGSVKADGSATAGPSERNAVYGHQLSSSKFPTSGISTTPVFQRARYYATGHGRFPLGYVFKLDREALGNIGVREYVVSEWVDNPHIPEDEEVILVAQDMGKLPMNVVVEIILVSAESGKGEFFSPPPHTTRRAGPHRAVPKDKRTVVGLNIPHNSLNK